MSTHSLAKRDRPDHDLPGLPPSHRRGCSHQLRHLAIAAVIELPILALLVLALITLGSVR